MYTRWIPFLNKKNIILASSSPRIKEILSELGFNFEIHKTFNLRLRKNLQDTKNAYFSGEGKNFIKNPNKIRNNDFPQNSHQKKTINIDTKKKFTGEDDDI